MDHQFQLPGSYKKWTYGLIAVGLVALLYGVFRFQPWIHSHHGSHVDATRFWAVLVLSFYWLLMRPCSLYVLPLWPWQDGL